MATNVKKGDLLYHSEVYYGGGYPQLITTEYEVTHAGKTFRVEPLFQGKTVLKDRDMAQLCRTPEEARRQGANKRRLEADRAQAAYERAERELIEYTSLEPLINTRERQKKRHEEAMAKLRGKKGVDL